MSEELVITKGSARPIEVCFQDENGDPEAFVGADAATFVVRSSLTDSSAVLDRRTSAANLSIDIPAGKLVATLTQGEADALSTGFFIGEAAVRIGGIWFHSDAFHVRIIQGTAPHS